MSAYGQNFVYMVKTANKNVQENTITQEAINRAKNIDNKYPRKNDAKKS